MLQRDYIQRLIREFMAALERMLEKKEVEVRREKIKELYNQYVGPYAFYSIATIEDVIRRWQELPTRRSDSPRWTCLPSSTITRLTWWGSPQEMNC